MPITRTKTLQPPVGGVNKRYAYQNQAPFTCVNADNVWPFDQLNGRGRIGTRAGLSAFASSPSGAPYNWCTAAWHNSGLKVGVALTTANGCFVWDGSAWTEWITTAPGTDFATPAVISQTLIMARGGGTTKYQPLTGSAGAGTDLGSHPSVVGTPPTKCGVACEHGSRLFLGGDTDNSQQMYASRASVFYDWDYAEPDDGAAFSIAFEEPITAMLSHTRDCLLIGFTDSLQVLRGTETTSLVIEMISSEVGPLMQSAWCHDSQGTCWMLTRDGLYSMKPGCGDFVESISREVLPSDLLAIDPGAGDKVSVAYDHRWRGLHIYVNYQSGTDVQYFFDLQNGGFWPMSFEIGTLQLAIPIKRSMTAIKSGLIALTPSGSAYQFDRGSNEVIDSFVEYAPVMLSDANSIGILTDISATLTTDSGPVNYEIYAGNSPEQVHASVAAGTSIAFSGLWTLNGYNYRDHPRVGDECFSLVLRGVEDPGDLQSTDWAIEEVVATIQGRGFRRVI